MKEWLFRSPARLRNHWTSQLDKALQSCQSRETFGIPVGPDTSRIIAEIILAGIEKKKDFASAIQGRDRFRLVDDFFIGFDDESSSVHALNALRRALWDFNLQLNEEKTKTKQSKEIFRDKWKHDFETLHIDISDDGKQEKDIHRLVDVTLAACIEARTSAPTGWACRRLARLQHTQNNFGLVLEALFRLSRDYPYCTSHVAEFLINKQHLCNDIALRPKIEAWIKSTLRLHFEHDHHFELTWTLLACGVLRIKLDEEDLRPFDKKINSAVFALLGLLRERGLLAVPLSKWSWRSQVKSRGIHGENWLPYYEAVRRKWTKDKDMIAAVKKDAVLSKMLTEGVTFLEDRILDAGRINITRRTFRPTTSHPHEKPTENRGRTPRNRLPSASDATVLRRIDHPEFDEDFDNELYGDPADVFELDFDDDDY